jgi:hypothetical protein
MEGFERNRSPSYLMLRASARRVDRLIQAEIARQGGCAVVYTDQLECCGSRRTYVPAMAELHALGLIEVTRHPKRYVCRLSDRWRQVTAQDARIASTLAREHCNDAGTQATQPSHAASAG